MELELLASGRDADVYLLDDERVLRRYRDGGSADREVLYMQHVRANDFPAPEVLRVAGPDLEMPRLVGPTMLDALLSNEIDSTQAAEMLADLLWRLHAMPALEGSDPSLRVVHLDLHPYNVILTPDGPFVIDWRNARDADPAMDVAMSALILAQVGLAGDPLLAEPALDLMYVFRERVGRGFLTGLPAAAQMRSQNPTLSPTELAVIDEAVALIADPRRR